ncbi:anti-sigma factor [Ancylobacter polymorphus]|uniref:Anti-sigma-K factor RskA n=1 Tax=Ancylobacter polymorphus TaxID=223390 RepID=A0ABU0BDS4_9HYPH|nr:anti-sigma factor [Ancylobacter polymorphus]MDQ0303989.1 anti-sigma-K factor RskA [Ancylobacter polymorphus]
MSADERDRLASEYVLGLLDAEEMRRCEERLARDAGLAVQVELWRARLAELDATAAPVTPDPALWPRIEAALGPVAPATPRRVARPSRLATWWQSLSLWRFYGLAASAALVLLAIGTAQLARQAAQAPVLVAVLLSDQNQPAAVVNAFRDGRTELLALSALKAPEGKSLQVWTLWDRERGPVSVGLLEAMRNVELSVEGLPRPAAAQLYEVTLEPAGGSPTGRPTGPILMKGNASPTETGI